MKVFRLIFFVFLFAGIIQTPDILAQAGNEKSEQKTSKDSSKTWKDKLFFGGSLGAQFGSLTIVELNPVVGYRFTPRLAVGIGGRYSYYNDRRSLYFTNTDSVISSSRFNTHIYGGSVFTRYTLIKDLQNVLPLKIYGGIYAHAEYELLSLESRYFDLACDFSGKRFLLHSVLVGGGYHQKIGRKSYIYLELLWNLTETINTPYENPVFRIGFTF